MRKLFSLFLLSLFGLMGSSTAYAENFYTFGLGAGVAPRYIGGKDYSGHIMPVFSAEFSNGLFISLLDGVGYQKTFENGIFVSVALNYDFGRSDSNRANQPGSDYLKGMGSIPGSLVTSFQVGATVFGNTVISVTLDQPLTHTGRGVSGHFDVATPVLHTANDTIIIMGSLHAGSARYMQTFFGVTDAQSASSGFRPYSVKAGFDRATLSAASTHSFTPKWSLQTSAGLTRILGSSADSPIVQKKNAYFATTAVTYRY